MNNTTIDQEINDASERLFKQEVIYGQSLLVDELLKKEILSYDDIMNLFDEETEETKEIFEWWIVSDWMAEKLKEENEPILETDYGTWWGRTCFGQAVDMDDVIRRIAQKYFMRKE